MLHRFIQEFLAYCRLADFSHRSLQALAIRLNEFTAFLKSQRIRSIKKVTFGSMDFGFVAASNDLYAVTIKGDMLYSEIFAGYDALLDFYGGFLLERKFSLSTQTILYWLKQSVKKWLMSLAVFLTDFAFGLGLEVLLFFFADFAFVFLAAFFRFGPFTSLRVFLPADLPSKPKLICLLPPAPFAVISGTLLYCPKGY